MTNHVHISHSLNTALKQTKNSLNIFYINIRSIRNKTHEIQNFLNNNKRQTYHILVIAETWLRDYEVGYLGIPGYTAYNSTRPNRDGGGVSIYILNTIQTNLEFEYADNYTII